MSAEVAVLMAAYNAETTLRAAVDSTLASTVPCDLFIVDDCSRVPVEQTIGTRQNVTIIRLPRNRVLAAALNVGLAHILPLKYKLLLFAIPRRVVTTLKAEWRSWHPDEHATSSSNLPHAASEIAKRQP